MDALKILMVDDEERMRKLVKDFLTNKGFSVVEAGDGEEALEIFFAQKDIALILLDVMMPKMDGWEVLKTIRKYSKVPVIMLTARSEERPAGARRWGRGCAAAPPRSTGRPRRSRAGGCRSGRWPGG